MPPKATSSELRSRFLFVNENANTVNRVSKDPELDREKQSHVQRHNFAQRAAKRDQAREYAFPLRSTSTLEQFVLPTTGDDLNPDWASFDAYMHAESQQSFNEIGPLMQNAAFPPPSHDQSSHSQLLLANHNSHKSSPLQRNILQSTTVHPLFSGSTQILEKWAPALFRHWNTTIIPEKFFADIKVRPLAEMRHAAAVHEESTNALRAPEHLYTFLALAATRMLKREGKLNLPDVREEDYYRVPLYFEGKAMGAIRKALAKGVTREVVVDVHRLTATASFSTAHNAATPHFNAMMSMIESLGGLETLGDYVEETIILHEWSAGLRKLEPVRIPVTWDPGHGTPEIAAKLESLSSTHDRLGELMTSIITEGQVQPEIAKAFTNMIQLTRFHHWASNQNEYVPEHFRYILLRHSAIGSRLLALGSASTTRNEALRIALVFEIGLIRSPGAKRCAAEGMAKLKYVLESSDLDDWQELDNLLLWIATIGGLTARKPDEVDWFASLAAKVAKRLDPEIFSDFGKMENLLSGFLYDPELQREALLDLRQRMRKTTVIA